MLLKGGAPMGGKSAPGKAIQIALFKVWHGFMQTAALLVEFIRIVLFMMLPGCEIMFDICELLI